MSSYYEDLEVSEKASKEVIEKAYRVLAKKYHPDLQTNENKAEAEKKMKTINEAYEVLMNDAKREEYNGKLEAEKKEKLEKELENEARKYQQVKPQNTTVSNINVNEVPEQAYNVTYKTVTRRRTIWDNLTWKKVRNLSIFILVLVFIGWILWIIPSTKEVVYDNPVVKVIIDVIISIFNVKL